MGALSGLPPAVPSTRDSSEPASHGSGYLTGLWRLAPGRELYAGPDGVWRCAGPGDRFSRLRGYDDFDRLGPLLRVGRHTRSELLCRLPQAGPVLDALRRAGVVTVSPSDATSAGAVRGVVHLDGGGPPADALATILGEHQGVHVRHGPVDEAAVASADVVVSVAARLPDRHWLLVDDWCAAHGTARHLVLVEGDRFVIGPFGVPGVSAGYRDLRGRRLAAGAADELRALWAHLEIADEGREQQWPAGPEVAVAAGYTARDVLAHLRGEPAPGRNHQIECVPGEPAPLAHPVLPLPPTAVDP
ncbi:hypothetical protein [Micromonospora sp. NBC_01813]|uniref:hypothetical protein n=1 Tax=Micromonospora sp. NBC_01813 TaxID=2975988 RepID=UPI002DDAAFF9|nr:hypothetical protein [Micromonospora sp. NBC_01813]WSA10785.1 hypothetical protein OG958_08400 [Micromonospora sp. NBC_01813]